VDPLQALGRACWSAADQLTPIFAQRDRPYFSA
jgi:hypothetical protein